MKWRDQESLFNERQSKYLVVFWLVRRYIELPTVSIKPQVYAENLIVRGF